MLLQIIVSDMFFLRSILSKLLYFVCLPLMFTGKSMKKVISVLHYSQIPIYLNDRSLGKCSGDFLFNYL